MSRFYAQPAPSGGAVSLLWAVPAGSTPLILATLTPTPPATPLTPPAGARVIVNASTRTLGAQNPFVTFENPKLEYRSWFDVFRGAPASPSAKDLESSVTTYHLYAVTGAVLSAPISLTVDARAPRTTVDTPIVRDFIRSRLDYHIGRAIIAGKIKGGTEDNYIPVHERESLSSDDPLPCVLLRETRSPSGNDTVGKVSGNWTDKGSGKAYRTRTFRERCRIDLLALSESPAERTMLAKIIDDGLKTDYALFESAGFDGMTISRSTNSAMVENRVQFGEEITLEGEIHISSLEEMLFHVTDNQARITVKL